MQPRFFPNITAYILPTQTILMPKTWLHEEFHDLMEEQSSPYCWILHTSDSHTHTYFRPRHTEALLLHTQNTHTHTNNTWRVCSSLRATQVAHLLHVQHLGFCRCRHLAAGAATRRGSHMQLDAAFLIVLLACWHV